jgi:transcriptional antiterminator RfaH
MTDQEPATAPAGLHWYCVRSQPKHEHIAAARLRQEGVEVFLPRIRFRKASARGPVWFTEPLFPNYLFAQFDWHRSARLVRHAAGVSTIVSFGPHVPSVPDEVLAQLREHIGPEELRVLGDALAPGDAVQISGGAFHGLVAVVTQVLPARDRVRLLLDFLGRQTSVEVDAEDVVKDMPPRQRVL